MSMREQCQNCCAECFAVYNEIYYANKSVILQQEQEFANGFLMKLVHILRNIYFATKSGKMTFEVMIVNSDCFHIKLLYQLLVLSTATLDTGNILDAKNILAIAANWLALRLSIIYTSTYGHTILEDIAKVVSL